MIQKIKDKIKNNLSEIKNFENLSEGDYSHGDTIGFLGSAKKLKHQNEALEWVLTLKQKKRKDFEITTKTISIPRDDILWDINQEVAIYVKNMNKHDDFSEVIKLLNEIMEELK